MRDWLKKENINLNNSHVSLQKAVVSICYKTKKETCKHSLSIINDESTTKKKKEKLMKLAKNEILNSIICKWYW